MKNQEFKINSKIDLHSLWNLLSVASFPYWINIVYKDNISRQMQKFYFGGILDTILKWNMETGIFCYDGTEEAILDKDELDYIIRYYFYFKRVNIKGDSIKIAKTLKMNKANKKECLDYFDTVIRHFSKLGCYIESPNEQEWI